MEACQAAFFFFFFSDLKNGNFEKNICCFLLANLTLFLLLLEMYRDHLHVLWVRDDLVLVLHHH